MAGFSNMERTPPVRLGHGDPPLPHWGLGQALENTILFTHLTDLELNVVADAMAEICFPKGTVIHEQGVQALAPLRLPAPVKRPPNFALRILGSLVCFARGPPESLACKHEPPRLATWRGFWPRPGPSAGGGGAMWLLRAVAYVHITPHGRFVALGHAVSWWGLGPGTHVHESPPPVCHVSLSEVTASWGW